jgi:hypothetical protein
MQPATTAVKRKKEEVAEVDAEQEGTSRGKVIRKAPAATTSASGKNRSSARMIQAREQDEVPEMDEHRSKRPRKVDVVIPSRRQPPVSVGSSSPATPTRRPGNLVGSEAEEESASTATPRRARTRAAMSAAQGDDAETSVSVSPPRRTRASGNPTLEEDAGPSAKSRSSRLKSTKPSMTDNGDSALQTPRRPRSRRRTGGDDANAHEDADADDDEVDDDKQPEAPAPPILVTSAQRRRVASLHNPFDGTIETPSRGTRARTSALDATPSKGTRSHNTPAPPKRARAGTVAAEQSQPLGKRVRKLSTRALEGADTAKAATRKKKASNYDKDKPQGAQSDRPKQYKGPSGKVEVVVPTLESLQVPASKANDQVQVNEQGACYTGFPERHLNLNNSFRSRAFDQRFIF